MNRFEELFINTFRELDTRSRSTHPYDLVKCAGLIRLLLLDRYPLVNRANTSELRITFDMPVQKIENPKDAGFAPTFFARFDGINPDVPLSDNAEIKKHSLKAFLSKIVMTVEEHDVRIKDIIRFEAHITGGIHAGDVTDVKDKAIEGVAGLQYICDIHATAYQIKSISRVVVRALQPLHDDIMSRYS
jgi:hypothetical protein